MLTRWKACYVKAGAECRAQLQYMGDDIEVAWNYAKGNYGRGLQGVYAFDLARPEPAAHERAARVILPKQRRS